MLLVSGHPVRVVTVTIRESPWRVARAWPASRLWGDWPSDALAPVPGPPGCYAINYHPAVPKGNSDSELEQQRAAIETDFREGWVLQGVGEPRVLTERDYAEAGKIIGKGGWAGLDRMTIEAVRGGARPGDLLPPSQSQPFINHVSDPKVIIHGEDSNRRVAVLYSHDHFPGVRFSHRFRLESPRENREPIWLKEEIETGALHRMMRDEPAADDAGVIWTTWGN